MIVLTLAGNSSRFFTKGYDIVKYKLPLGSQCIIEAILSYLPKNVRLLLVINKKFNDYIFFEELLKSMNFLQFKIIEVDDTRGQLESVVKGLELSNDFFNLKEPITIYNGDTIRIDTNWELFQGDGYVETFIAEGNHWSFVDTIGKVDVVTEKERISSYCSSGLYYFNSAELILNNVREYIEQVSVEIYIAPFYNFLISKGFDVYSGLVPKDSFIFCGTPEEYEESILKISK